MGSQKGYLPCTQEYACNTPGVEFIPDPNSVDTMNNWVKQMDLYCTSKLQMGLLGSSFISGCFVGSFILARMADIYGRRPIFIVGLSL